MRGGVSNLETKRLDAAIGVDRHGLFEGWASLFGVADAAGDVVMPGAFAASLARRGVRGVRMLWQHDPAEPVGAWLVLAETPRGLAARGRLNLAVQRGRELFALIAEGAIDGLSIGFRAERARTDPRSGARRLERIDLWEVSLVTFPMLPGARVFAVERAASPAGAIRRATAAAGAAASAAGRAKLRASLGGCPSMNSG